MLNGKNLRTYGYNYGEYSEYDITAFKKHQNDEKYMINLQNNPVTVELISKLRCTKNLVKVTFYSC